MPPANTGSFYELADGTWGVQYRLPDGTRKRRSGFRHKTAARRLAHRQRAPRRPRPTACRGIRAHARRARRPLPRRHEAIRSPRTIATLRERLARPLRVYGDVRLAELEGMSDELADFRATLSPRYAHKVMGALRQVLTAGVRWRLTDREPGLRRGREPGAEAAPGARLHARRARRTRCRARTALRAARPVRRRNRATAGRVGRARAPRHRPRPPARVGTCAARRPSARRRPRGSAHRPSTRCAGGAAVADSTRRSCSRRPPAAPRARELPPPRVDPRGGRGRGREAGYASTTYARRSPRTRSPPE